MDTLFAQASAVMQELGEKAKLKAGDIVVIGCSTSEITGARIGSNSNPDIAALVFEAVYAYAGKMGWRLAFQCCEHLNRAIVTERETVPGAETVNVIPQPKAGGSMATQAYRRFAHPVVVEGIQADAGIDIGFTLIGMHLKRVASPFAWITTKSAKPPFLPRAPGRGLSAAAGRHTIRICSRGGRLFALLRRRDAGQIVAGSVRALDGHETLPVAPVHIPIGSARRPARPR